MGKINDLTITSLETITAFDVATGDYKFTMDELQKATIAQAEEKTDITGKQGRKLTSLKKNKALTVSGTNGLISGGLLEVQTGGKFTNKATEVLWKDYLTVSGNKVIINYVARGDEGSEIESVTIKSADGIATTELVQGDEAADGVFTYTPQSKTITFATGAYKDGTEVVVNYKRQIKADVLENMSDVYSGKCTLYIDAIAEDTCANLYRVQIYIPKADFNGEFSLELGDNQTVHEFEAEAMAGACGAGGALWTYTVFGANAEDAA